MKPDTTLALALLLLVPGLAPAAAVERILRFVSDVTVERNGDLVGHRDDPRAGRGQRDPPRHSARFPHDLPAHRRHACRGRLQRSVGDARRRAGELDHREHEQRRARAHRQRRPHALHRAARIRHPLPHHAPDRLLRRLRRALLERDRQRLDLRDRPGRGAHHPAGGGAVQADAPSTPARRARRARTRRWSSSGPATSCSAPPGRCRRATGSPSRPPGRRALSSRRRRRSRRPIGSQDNVAIPVAGVGPRAGAWLLRACLARGRPRSAERHHHPAVRAAGRACRRRPCAMSIRWASTTAASPPPIIDLGVNGHLKIVGSGKNIDHRAARRAAARSRPKRLAMEHKLFQRPSARSSSRRPTTSSSARPRSALKDSLKQAYRRQAVQQQLRLVGRSGCCSRFCSSWRCDRRGAHATATICSRRWWSDMFMPRRS